MIAAFLIPNFGLYLLVAAVSILFAAQRHSNPVAQSRAIPPTQSSWRMMKDVELDKPSRYGQANADVEDPIFYRRPQIYSWLGESFLFILKTQRADRLNNYLYSKTSM